MQISTRESANGKELTISIAGRFDHTLQQAFRNAYRFHNGRPVLYRVDLERTEYMDSSALGMLLLLRDHARAGGAEVQIRTPAGRILEILQMAHFERMFNIISSPRQS